ncbi:ABC transporter permease [Enterobacter sp. RHBSTW-00994]|uniref:ABC transporter permease n=1 Tax=Enterobacteriaceae TaxID=543 RepID=UPI0015E93712|nr:MULTISPECIES: ABC transporter permease [Enterobacteriaceae]MBM3072865.1 ABC transporter permease subunit [Lelliottia sp. RWM.1]QLR45533.1 ABC transporter permease [Enterobacter sp. RHBSTW-00994]
METLTATLHWLIQPNHWSGDTGILLRLREHLWYVLISMAIASAIALPLGVMLGYWRKGAFLVINLFNIGRAIPSLGLILLCIILFGFNDVPVFLALVALSIPPILTNTWVGIYHADRTLCDAAIALGMTPLQSLWQLRIPLAMPLIFAGIRTALLQLIATAVVAAYAGLGGLGRFLIDGLGQRDMPQVIAGSLVVTLLAIACEALFSLIGKRIFRLQAASALN